MSERDYLDNTEDNDELKAFATVMGAMVGIATGFGVLCYGGYLVGTALTNYFFNEKVIQKEKYVQHREETHLLQQQDLNNDGIEERFYEIRGRQYILTDNLELKLKI